MLCRVPVGQGALVVVLEFYSLQDSSLLAFFPILFLEHVSHRCKHLLFTYHVLQLQFPSLFLDLQFALSGLAQHTPVQLVFLHDLLFLHALQAVLSLPLPSQVLLLEFLQFLLESEGVVLLLLDDLDVLVGGAELL